MSFDRDCKQTKPSGLKTSGDVLDNADHTVTEAIAASSKKASLAAHLQRIMMLKKAAPRPLSRDELKDRGLATVSRLLRKIKP